MKQLRKEKQREEEEGLQRSRGEDMRQKCGTRGEFIVHSDCRGHKSRGKDERAQKRGKRE